jgi:hypothetical protein
MHGNEEKRLAFERTANARGLAAAQAESRLRRANPEVPVRPNAAQQALDATGRIFREGGQNAFNDATDQVKGVLSVAGIAGEVPAPLRDREIEVQRTTTGRPDPDLVRQADRLRVMGKAAGATGAALTAIYDVNVEGKDKVKAGASTVAGAVAGTAAGSWAGAALAGAVGGAWAGPIGVVGGLVFGGLVGAYTSGVFDAAWDYAAGKPPQPDN